MANRQGLPTPGHPQGSDVVGPIPETKNIKTYGGESRVSDPRTRVSHESVTSTEVTE